MTVIARISIHAPLAGCDRPHRHRPRPLHISIHAPHAGRDPIRVIQSTLLQTFQSTHPLRGATTLHPAPPPAAVFQSTHPLRGATHLYAASALAADISIHAPLAGRDSGDPTHRSAPPYFNPRTPCGVRRIHTSHGTIIRGFQSTHPLRGATSDTKGHFACPLISIHAPLAGCDHLRRYTYRANSNFNPRAPCGVRLPKTYADMLNFVFQSTRPLRGATEDAL